MPLPIDLTGIQRDLQRGVFRQRLKLDNAARILLFLGRINRLKGLDVLIEAVEPLLDSTTVLAVVGRDDGHWDELSRRHRQLLADGRMRFIGPLYGQERFAAYADADVFCLTPRHWEETSVAALEAAACGTPLVLTEQSDVPGLNESGGGFVVKLDPGLIREAVRQTLRDREKIGRRALLLVQRQHARGVVVARLEAYFADAVERRESA